MSDPSWAERLGGAAAGTLAGVAGGAMLGPPGMIVGGLVGLARSLTSQPHADDEAPALQQVAQALTGVVDQAQQVAAIQADPVKAEEFRVAALRIRAEAQAARDAHMLALVEAANRDTANARATNLSLAETGSVIAWGAPVMSVIVLALFGSTLALILWRGLPPGSNEVVLLLIGVLAGMAQTAVAYYLGSSAGSASKDRRLAVERERP